MNDDRDIGKKDIGEVAREHLDSPEVPRDRMWERIDAARVEHRGVLQPEFTPRPRPAWRYVRLAAGIAAVLLVGVLIGRTIQDPGTIPSGTPVAGTEVQGPGLHDPAAIEREVYGLAANDLFGRADFLLTDFKVRGCDSGDLAAVPEWAGGMLVQTRLLMGTPVADDPVVSELLDELELVLAQIVGLSRDNCARDMAWIRSGLENRSTIDRLRRMTGPGGTI